MRHLMLLLVALMSCAPALGPASRPVAVAPASTPAESLPPLDDRGQRELLAGFELVLGDERAKTAAADQRASDAERRTALIGVASALVATVLTILFTR